MLDLRSGLATAIGSLPHQDPVQAVRLVLRYFKDIPFWPQLPKRSPLENMCLQYIEGLPCLRIDKERGYSFDTSRLELELERFYERYLANDIDYFRISPEYANGLSILIDLLKERRDYSYVKGHVTGPITFGFTIKDDRGRSIIYNKEIMDGIIKGLIMKAKWQIKTFMELGAKAIIFIDEPYLSSFGSAFFNISRDEVLRSLNEVIFSIKEMGGIAGIHCCGNTDWSMLLATGVDILNFDAYSFFDGISLYPQELNEFLKRGGILAWGIIPSSPRVMDIALEDLIRRLDNGMDILIKNGIKEDSLSQSLITPSCGCGSLTEKEAERVLELTLEVSTRQGGRDAKTWC